MFLNLLFSFAFLLPLSSQAAPEPALRSSLTLYAYPPRNPLDWRSPAKTMRSFIGNLIDQSLQNDEAIHFTSEFGEPGQISSSYISSMGHTIARVRCQTHEGKLYDRWVSFSGQDYREEDNQLLFKDKVGVGALFHKYPDGHILAGTENIRRITYYNGAENEGQKVRPRYLEIEIQENSCEELVKIISFFESFHFAPGTSLAQLKARPAAQTLYFTNTIDPFDSYQARMQNPNTLVGGGCAPFGAALVKASGRYLPIFDQAWKAKLRVSERLIGGSLAAGTQTKQVAVGDLLFSSLGQSWTFAGSANRTLEMVDPQKIWGFLGASMQCLADQKCDRLSAQFLAQEKGRLSVGPLQKFEDVFDREVSHGADSSSSQWITETTIQPVQGLVWRLR